MSYASDPAGLGVGQAYGPRVRGGGSGELAALAGDEKQIVFDVTAATSGFPLEKYIEAENYYLKEMVVELNTDFAAGSTLNISVDSGAGVTSAVAIDSLGAVMAVKALATDTTLANKVGSGPKILEISLNSLASASTVGDAKVAVVYKRL